MDAPSFDVRVTRATYTPMQRQDMVNCLPGIPHSRVKSILQRANARAYHLLLWRAREDSIFFWRNRFEAAALKGGPVSALTLCHPYDLCSLDHIH